MNLSIITSLPNFASILNKYKINTPLRMAHFLAQLAHESTGFTVLQENLNYSASGLLNIFGKYFNSTTASQFARKPQAIANKVYANRLGNGSESSGDGWRYRGRGFIQLTGKGNYQAYKNASGYDVVSNPDLLLNKDIALDCACWFWNMKNISPLADKDDVLAVTKKINGGTNGLADRKTKLSFFKKLDLLSYLGQKKTILFSGLSIVAIGLGSFLIYKYLIKK